MSLGKIIFIVLLLAIAIAAAIFGPRFYRVNQMIHLYDEGKISENFINKAAEPPRLQPAA